MQDQYIQAIQDSANIKAPESNYPAISAMYDSSYQALAGESALKGYAGYTSDVMQQKRAAASSGGSGVSVRKKELERKLNPNNYKKIVDDDGGYHFEDPDGNRISLNQYVKDRIKLGQMTGVSIQNPWHADNLKGSARAIDKKFLQDWNTMTELGQLVESGAATKDLDKFFTKNANLAPIRKELLKMGASDLIGLLEEQYPHVFSDSPDATSQIPTVQDAGTQPAGLNFFQKAINQITPGTGSAEPFGTQNKMKSLYGIKVPSPSDKRGYWGP